MAGFPQLAAPRPTPDTSSPYRLSVSDHWRRAYLHCSHCGRWVHQVHARLLPKVERACCPDCYDDAMEAQGRRPMTPPYDGQEVSPW